MTLFRVGEAPGALLREAAAPYSRALEARIADGLVCCPRHGDLDASSCHDCPWSLGRSTDGQHNRCLVAGSEALGVWMRPACRIAIATRATPCAEAEQRARSADSHDLLVLDQDRALIGVVCRCDLQRRAGGTVGDCMPGDVYVTGPATPLVEAFATMRALAVSCLPVIQGSFVIGVITRADLVRAAVPGATEQWRRDCKHVLTSA